MSYERISRILTNMTQSFTIILLIDSGCKT